MAVVVDMKAIAICIFYLIISLSLILLNQHILRGLHFPYPIFLCGLGIAVSAIFAQILVRTNCTTLQRKSAVEGLLWYRRILPVGLAHAATLAFGNAVYLYLDVGFVQMLKSFTPVVILATSYALGLEKPTSLIVVCVLLICVGTAITCTFTPNLSILGLVLMSLSISTEAVRLVLTQFLLQQLKFSVVESQYVLAPATAFWLFLASYMFESQSMLESGALKLMVDNGLAFALASCFGVVVNFSSYAVIQNTSSLTMKVLVIVRGIVTVLVGVLFYAELLTWKATLGYTLTLASFVVFNLAKTGYINQDTDVFFALTSRIPCRGKEEQTAETPQLGAPMVDEEAALMTEREPSVKR